MDRVSARAGEGEPRPASGEEFLAVADHHQYGGSRHMLHLCFGRTTVLTLGICGRRNIGLFQAMTRVVSIS